MQLCRIHNVAIQLKYNMTPNMFPNETLHGHAGADNDRLLAVFIKQIKLY